jgi:hypothetical protein
MRESLRKEQTQETKRAEREGPVMMMIAFERERWTRKIQRTKQRYSARDIDDDNCFYYFKK